MKVEQTGNRSWLRIAPTTPERRQQKVHEAIAKRAFQIWEGRNSEPGSQLTDWRRAESEVHRPLNCGYLMLDDKIELSTDATCFGDGEIEICVEPQRLTVCGKERIGEPERQEGAHSKCKDGLIFRFIDLPERIIPAHVTARFHGPVLLIALPRARASQNLDGRKAA